jgi:photosystem II stability/assembly factor-like uncharacterized protein
MRNSVILAAISISLGLGGCAAQRRPADPQARVQTDPSNQPPRAVNPYEALRWRQLQWQDENGRIPRDGWRRAFAQREAVVASTFSRGLRATGGIELGNWEEHGPNNVGGRTRAMLIDPDDPNHMWTGGVSGGIWSSTDRGATWAPVDDFMSNLAICCLAADPNDPNHLFAGTGEGFFNGDGIRGRGIFESTDRGVTWSQISGTEDWQSVNRIAISTNGVVLAGLNPGGIRRSTVAGGSWSQRLNAQACLYVAFDPTDSSKAIGHALVTSLQWYHKAVYSTDGGLTWHTASGLNHEGGFGSRIELAYAPSDPSIVYASCARDGSVWRSTDGGQSYTQRSTPETDVEVSWYANPIWVDPTDPDVVVTGGASRFFRSIDGGLTFAQISSGYIMTTDPHPDLHFIGHDPGYNGTTNRRVYVGTDGGLWCTDDIRNAATGSGWYKREQSYRTSQFYGAAGHGPSGLIIGGTQDNGTLRVTTSNSQAHLMYGGDGGFCAIDSEQPNICFGEYITLQIHRSLDGGTSASDFTGNMTDANNSANFIAPFILDPNKPNQLLAGGASLWRTSDTRRTLRPPNYTAIRPPGSDLISAIAVAPGNSDIIWVGQNNGVVSRTLDGTTPAPSWTDIDDNGGSNPLPNRYIERILVDPDDSDVVYVSLGGFSPDNLWRTVDGGTTWADITGGIDGIPEAPINGIARHPLHPGWLYVGTEVGIFATMDGGATWSASNEGPADVSVDELTFMSDSRRLLAATHGRGLFTIELPGVSYLDFDGDGDVDAYDFARFPECHGPPGVTPNPEAPLTTEDCLLAYDTDSDGDVDLTDYRTFQSAFTGWNALLPF